MIYSLFMTNKKVELGFLRGNLIDYTKVANL